jgi:peptidoglycan/LPS O-acetylase OafA/YrhL
MRLCLTIAVASLVLRTAMLLAGSPTEAVYTFLVSRMDALALGGFAAAAFRTPSIAAWALHHRRSLLYGGIVLLLAGAVISRGYYFSNTMTLTLGYTLLAVAFALLVATGVAADRLGTSAWAAVLRSTVLRKVGQYSYAMYILHVPLHALVGQPILRALGLLSKDSAIVAIFYIVIGTVVTYLVAAASFHFLEVHFLRLKDRFSPATVIPPASR